ncbi:MAG: ribokinase [Actinobacteria bacterium]|nr:ribokinase [Actinomycetota bacterium]
MNSVVVVGSLNVDHVLKVKELPLKGETIISESYDLHEGGKGANQAVAIGRLGMDVCMIGKIGKDVYGEMLLESLTRSNVRIESMIVDKKLRTGIALITVDRKGNNTILLYPGANWGLKINDILKNKKMIKECDIVVLQQEIPKDVISFTIDIAKELKKTVILNFAPALGLSKDSIKKVDFLILNELEISKLTGIKCNERNVEEPITWLKRFFKNNIIVTLGEYGSVCMTSCGDYYRIPSISVNSVDSTGAGDAFIGGFVYGLVQKKNINNCVILGNVAGAIAVKTVGAQASLPYENELKKFLETENINYIQKEEG